MQTRYETSSYPDNYPQPTDYNGTPITVQGIGLKLIFVFNTGTICHTPEGIMKSITDLPKGITVCYYCVITMIPTCVL